MMTSVDQCMEKALSDGIFPGAQLLAARCGKIFFRRAYGIADRSTHRKVSLKTVFDLASLTKPLATTLAAMLLVQAEKLSIGQPLCTVLPEFCKSDKADIRIAQLLYHTAGLPDYRPFYLALKNLPIEQRKNELRQKLVSEPLAAEPGKSAQYSDIGFMILEWVIEKVSGTDLDVFVQENIYNPLTISDLFFIRHDRFVPNREYAATEECPWRQKMLCGEVHDDNAHVVGGVAGHAGLFGTADAVYAILSELMRVYSGNPGRRVFQTAAVQLFLKKNDRAGRALGFDVPSPSESSSGDFFSQESSVGHLGFTGTSFWMDVKQETLVILLTNRVHPSRENDRIRAFRPIIHNQVMDALKKALPIE